MDDDDSGGARQHREGLEGGLVRIRRSYVPPSAITKIPAHVFDTYLFFQCLIL